MSEQEPSFTPVLSKEHQELAKLEAQLAQKQVEVEGKTAFGKFDGPMTPNEGEDTYDSYLDQRPDKGIVRDGDSFRGGESNQGSFASAEAYAAQNGTAQEHYDKVGGLENSQEAYKAPEYESMHFMALVKEAGKAKLLGDRAELDTIRGVVEHNLMEEATRPDSEWTDEEVADQLRRFDSLSEVYVNRANGAAAPEASEVHTTSGPEAATDTAPEAPVEAPADTTTPEVVAETESPVAPEAEPVAAATPEAASEAPVAVETESPAVAESETPVAAEVVEKRTETRRTGEVKLNGEIVTLGEEFNSESGRKAFEVTGADGTSSLVNEADLEFVEETVEIEETEKLSERLKKWWTSEKVSNAKEKFTLAYWGARWQTGTDRFIERGVDDEMTDDEKEYQRNRNRGKLMLGYSAIPLAAIGAGLFAHAGLEALGNVDTSALGPDTVTPPTGNETNVDLGGTDLNGTETGTEGYEAPTEAELSAENPVVAPAPEVAPVANPDFDVPAGTGGEALFNRLGIESQKWYDNEQSLLANFPTDFYQMEGGHVGIQNPGELSPQAQEYINNLR